MLGATNAVNGMAKLQRGRRDEKRIPVGGAVADINGEGFNVINWSRHGIMIGPYAGPLNAGDPFTFKFRMPMSDGEDFEFSVWANVVRTDGMGLAAHYVDLNDQVSATIEEMLEILFNSKA